MSNIAVQRTLQKAREQVEARLGSIKQEVAMEGLEGEHNYYLVGDKLVDEVALVIKGFLNEFFEYNVINEGQSFPVDNGARLVHKKTYEEMLSLGNWDLHSLGKEVIFAMSAEIVSKVLSRFE